MIDHRTALPSAVLCTLATATAQDPIPLEDVFAPVSDVNTWTYEDFDVEGLEPLVPTFGYYRFRINTNGIRFTGFREVVGSTVPEQHQSRLDLECFLPQAWLDDGAPPIAFPLLHIATVSESDDDALPSEGLQAKREMAARLAKKGTVATILWNEDELDDEGNPADPPPHKVFFVGGGQNALQRAGFRWIMAVPPTAMTPEVLAYDFRFGYTQGSILSKTFFRRFLARHHDDDPFWVTWADSVRTVHNGGSKSGGGAITSAGYDPDCVGLRVAGYGGYDDGPESFMPRYQSDWCEPLYATPGPELGPDEHYWLDFARWGWENADVHPSYFDTYIVGRDEARYCDKMMLDVVGTHDWINPLGCSTDFWPSRDGWDENGDPDPGEAKVWDFRLVRRINKNHGVPSLAHASGTPMPVSAPMGDLALFRMLRHLSAEAWPFPRMDLVSVDTTDPSIWMARVRLTGVTLPEDFRVHVALSDDRDFRRCLPPIEHNGTSRCYNRPHDTNDEDDVTSGLTPFPHPSEDVFLTIEVDEATEVVATGDVRDIYFEAPAAALAEFFAEPGAGHPMVATIVELELRDAKPQHLKGDLFLHSDAAFTHVVEASCPR